jgi:hypothetical protein
MTLAAGLDGLCVVSITKRHAACFSTIPLMQESPETTEPVAKLGFDVISGLWVACRCAAKSSICTEQCCLSLTCHMM